MKKIVLIATGLMLVSSLNLTAQNWANLKKKATDKAGEIKKTGLPSAGLSEEEVGRGLKEALNQGIKKGVEQVNKKDGYLKDPQITIPMPLEAKKAEEKLRAIGQGAKVDQAIESMNRAAEDAANGAKDIFVAAIKSMTLSDAMSILKGDKDAATQYLSKATMTELTAKFQPLIKVSLDKVGATKHWEIVFGTYNKLPFVTKINPKLEEYVTERALAGLFIQVAKEELKIRDNPAARASELLKKVFAN